jgi:hypothetical protein
MNQITGLPYADITPPATQPGTTVFVVSCFAHARKGKGPK